MTPEYKAQLKLLRKALYGHYKTVAEESGVAVSTVSRVLNGDFENEKVIDKAIEMRDRLDAARIARFEILTNRINPAR